MSDWRGKQGPASFRGVSFHVPDAEERGGRNMVAHVYPGSEKAPYHDDMGKKPGTFAVTGYVIGDEYEADRDALSKALGTPGAGELKHPWFAEPRTVVCVDFSIRHTKDDGGMAIFSIQFEETTLSAKPTASIAGKQSVKVAAVAANLSIKQQFVAKFKPLATLNTSVTGALSNASEKVNDVISTVSLPTQAAASLTSQISQIQSGASSLLSSPDTLASTISTLFSTLSDALVTIENTAPHKLFQKIAAFTTGTRPPSTTAQRADEQNNFDAVTGYIQRAALIEAANLIVEVAFESFDDAERDRTSLLEDFENNLASDNTEDVAYVALVNLRTAIVNAVPGDDANLPRLLEYTPSVTTNTLVLSHSLYGDLSKELDIASRNHTRHPGFLLPSKTLEVLSD